MTSREFSGDRLAMSILMYFMYYWYAKDPGHLLLGLPASSLGAYGVICKAHKSQSCFIRLVPDGHTTFESFKDRSSSVNSDVKRAVTLALERECNASFVSTETSSRSLLNAIKVAKRQAPHTS